MLACCLRRVVWMLLVAQSLTIVGTTAKGQEAPSSRPATDLNRLRTTEADGVKSLDLSGTRATDAELAPVAAMEDLDKLILWNTQVTDAGLRHLEALKNLKVLGLSHQPISDQGLKHLEHLDQLRELHLWNTKITDAGLERLKALVNLDTLWIGSTQITDAGLVHLSGLTKLKKLILNETSISDPGLAHLEGLTQLEDLGLWNTKVAGSGLKHLASLERLQVLALGHTQIADDDLALLRGLTQLRELNLVRTRVTNSGMEVVGGFRELQTLYLSNTAITDEGLASLGQLTKLETLHLDFTKIKGDGLVHLKGMTSLKRLSLWNTLLNDDGLRHIEPLTGLELLNVANTPITDAGLERIENLVHLTELYLSGTRVTDGGLPRLGKMADLQRLGLLRLRGVTDKGLVHLEGLKKLQDIRLIGTGVTPAGIAALKVSFPTATLSTGEPVRRSPPPDATERSGRVRPPRPAKTGPTKIALPDQGNGEHVEVVAETAKVKIGDEVVGTVRRGDRLPVLRREGHWIGIMFSGADGDRLGWLLGNRVRTILPAGFDSESAPPEIPDTVTVRIDHTQFGGLNPTKICFELSLTNTSSQPLPFDPSAVRLVVGSETLVAVERDEPQRAPSGRIPTSRPLSISVPEEDRRPAMRSWRDLPHWERDTVLKPGEQRSGWLAFEVPRSLYPSPGSYPPRPAGYRPPQTLLPGQSSQTDLATPPWKLSIPLQGETTHVDLVELERHAAIQTRSSSSDPAVTVIEFGPRISGLSVGRVLEVYEEVWSKKAPCVVLFKTPCLLIDSVARSRLPKASLQSGWRQVNSVWVNLPNAVSTAGGMYVGGTDEILSGGHVRLGNSEAEAVAQVLAAVPTGQSEQQTRRESSWEDSRRGATGSLRGDLRRPEVAQALIKAIGNTDTMVRVTAFSAIEASLSGRWQGDRLDTLRARESSVLEGELLDAVLAAATDSVPSVRYSAIRTLRYCQDPRVTSVVLEAFKDPESSVRSAAAEAAATRHTADVMPLLLEQTKDTDEHAALAACRTLAQFKSEACVPRLKTLQGSKNSHVANSATDALQEVGAVTEIEAAIMKLDQGVTSLRAADRHVLIATKDPRAVAKLKELIAKESREYPAERATCLMAEMGDTAALEPLLQKFTPGERISPLVPLALAKLGDPRVIAPLEQALARSYGPSRYAIVEALLILKAPDVRDRTVAEIRQSPQGEQTGSLLWALRRAEGDAALAVIEPFLDDERWHDAAAAILWDLGTPAAIAALQRKLSASECRHGAAVVRWTVESAAQIAASDDEAARLEQIDKLSTFLQGLAESNSEDVRTAAAQWLRHIVSGESHGIP